MRKTIWTLLVVIMVVPIASYASSTVTSEAPRVEWSKTYGHVAGHSIVQTSDGNLMILADKADLPHFGYHSYGYYNRTGALLKIDLNGEVLWTKYLPIIPLTEDRVYMPINSMITTMDGGFAITGFCQGIPRIGLVKTDIRGNIIWNQTFELPIQTAMPIQTARAKSILETRDGGFVLCGFVNPNASTFMAWLIRTDSLGNVLWIKTYGVEKVMPFNEKGAMSIVESNDEGYILVGRWDENGTSIVKIDDHGDIKWRKGFDQSTSNATYAYSTSVRYLFNSIIITDDSGYLLAGDQIKGSSSHIPFLMKLDANFYSLWNRTFEGYDGLFFNLQDTMEDGYLFTDGVSLMKTDLDCNLEWSTKYNGSIRSAKHTMDGGYVVTGYVPHNPTATDISQYITDICVTKLAAEPMLSFNISPLSLTTIVVMVTVIVAVLALLMYFNKRKR